MRHVTQSLCLSYRSLCGTTLRIRLAEAGMTASLQVVRLACLLAGRLAVLQASLPAYLLASKLASLKAVQQACKQDGWTACLPSREKTAKVRRMVIVMANSKGGVGKSTLAVLLAVWLHERGRTVILADCDSQHSSSEWSKEAAPGVRVVRLAGYDEVLNELPLLDKEADYVIADGPGSNTETSRALLLRADLAVVPCKASMLEVRALAQATLVLKQARDLRKGKPKAKIVLTMIGKNYRLTQDMKTAAKALKLSLADTTVTQRQVYADAPGQGTVVWKMGARAGDAAKEIDELFRELVPDAGTKRAQIAVRDKEARSNVKKRRGQK
jgi:chromosome partitioning protein